MRRVKPGVRGWFTYDHRVGWGHCRKYSALGQGGAWRSNAGESALRVWEESRHSGRIVVTEHAVLRDVYHPAAVRGSFAHVRESETDCRKLKRRSGPLFEAQKARRPKTGCVPQLP